MLPVVCFNDQSIPLVTNTLFSSSGEATAASLASVALGMSGNGKLVFIGAIELLVRCSGQTPEYSAFLEGICCLLAKPDLAASRGLILGCPTQTAEAIQKNLRLFDFVSDISRQLVDLSHYDLVVTVVDCTAIRELRGLLDRGGGVIVCGNGLPVSRSAPIRDLLTDFGMGLPSCSLYLGDPTKDFTKVKHDRSGLCFNRLAAHFHEALTGDDRIELSIIDPLVTTLRYHITTLPRSFDGRLEVIAADCWAYLDRTGAPSDGGVCPEVSQLIVAVLLADIMPRMPPAMHEGVHRDVPFPGPSNLVIGSFAIEAEFESDGWFSTGLYLPAGVMATATIDGPRRECAIQIGSHPDCVMTKLPPWRRYPCVVTRFVFDQATIEVSSPFGGIIYVVLDDFEIDSVQILNVRFQNVGRYPMYSIDDFSLWTHTRDFAAPWAEIESKLAIFTMPTSFLVNLQELNDAIGRVDDMIRFLLDFLSDDTVRRFRIIFDVVVNDGTLSQGYPIVLPVEALDDIFVKTAPTTCFTMLRLIADSSFPVGGFPPRARDSLITLAAYATAEHAWPDEPALTQVIRGKGRLFLAMLDIFAVADRAAFPEALAETRQRMSAGTRNREILLYRFFVKRLSAATQFDCATTLLDDVMMTETAQIGFVLRASPKLSCYRVAAADVC
jgi:hypothetical protein